MQLQPKTSPRIATLGDSGLPGVLADAHERARANAPVTARSYQIYFVYLDEHRRGVHHQTSTVSTIVRYYSDNRGHNKLPSNRSGRSLIFATAIMVLTLFFPLSQQRITAQTRSDPVVTLEQATGRIERVVYSVKRLKRTVPGRLPARKRSSPPGPRRCNPPPGTGDTRPRRVCS